MSVFLDALRSRLGDAGLLVGGDLSAYENDWRKRYAGKALGRCASGLDRGGRGRNEALP